MPQDIINKIMIEENIFPRWEHNIPTLGTKHSHAGNKTGLRLALDDISLTAGQSVALRTARAPRHFSDLKGTECGVAYGSCLTTLRLVITLFLMMVVGVSEMWGAFTEGLYYIKSNANAVYYLCPSIGCYYDNNVDQPHLTTFKTGEDQYSIWKIVPVEGETDTYYIIHYKTGRYLKSNENFTTVENKQTKNNRKAVHLEVKPATLTDEEDNKFKFLIKNSSSPYQIYPKVYYTDASGMSFNPTNEHQDCYAPADGAVTTGGAKGMIGLFNKDNAYSKWQIPSVPSAPCATPIIKYDGDNINISYPYSDETGITIYYTTDGSDPTTSSPHEESNSFNIPSSGVVKVRAFAAKSDYVNSDEAVLWGSARPFLIQSKECVDYYLVPAGNGTNVNTSSLPGTSMQWTLQNAGTSTGGVQYYYVVNSNNKKINYNSDYTLTLNDASVDANKFCIVENGYNTGNFFLIPVSQTNRVIYKVNGNVESDNCNADLNKKWDTNLDQWKFRICNDGVDQKSLFANSPFSVSTDEENHYYHIASVGATGYYIVPPTNADGFATASNTPTDYTDNPWIFKVAGSDNWLTYYYIINAASDKYMYFNPNIGLTDDQENVISMKDESEKIEGNEEKFQFVMVRSTTTDACYIVPKGYSYADSSHKNFYGNQYFGLWFDNNNPAALKTTWNRRSTGNHVKWTFESTNYTNVWADPVVTCDIDGHITITNGEEADGAEFYYTKNNSTTLPATPTATESETNFKYNSSSKPTADAGFTTIKVRAIANGKQKSNVVNNTIIYNPTVALTAESYTYTGAVQNPISSVKVGETPIASSEYEVKYQKEGEDTELTEVKDAGTYTILVKDVDGGDYIVYGKNTTVTISPAALTVTADAKTKVYGDADPALTYTSEGLIGTDAIIGDLSRDAGEDVGTYAINQNTLTAGNNYAITYTPANLTINKKSLGDGTTPAAGIVINIDGNDVVTVTRTSPTSVDLTLDTDFTVSSPTEVEGNQIWTITGINNYDGGAKVMRIGLTFNETEIPTGENAHDVTPYKASVDMTIDGLDAYKVTHVNMTKRIVTIKKINYVKKDEPLLLLTDLAGTELNYVGTATPLYVAEGDVADTSDNLLQVSPEGGKPVAFGEVYMYYQGKFVMTTGGTLPEGKFYLDNPNPPSSSGGGGTSNAPLRIVIDDTTDMEDVKIMMEDEREGHWYTLDGRRLNGKPTRKGLYLKEGKKIVIR